MSSRVNLFKRLTSIGSPIAIGLVLVFIVGCKSEKSKSAKTPTAPDTAKQLSNAFPSSSTPQSLPFNVHWPPIPPDHTRYLTAEPILLGELHVLATNPTPNDSRVVIQLELNRPTSEAARVRWNRKLKFPEFLWMSRLRVWDAEHEWLWTNLSHLLTAYGVDRVDRYGGLDPDKNVDNDFAAVVARVYHADGQESRATIDNPFVTARWKPPRSDQNNTAITKESLFHSAKTDVLQIPVGNLSDPTIDSSQGSIGVWMIYADFLFADPPRRWPKKKEFSGGILSYFTVYWKRAGDKIEIVAVDAATPPSETGVDWQTWVENGKTQRLK